MGKGDRLKKPVYVQPAFPTTFLNHEPDSEEIAMREALKEAMAAQAKRTDEISRRKEEKAKKIPKHEEEESESDFGDFEPIRLKPRDLHSKEKAPTPLPDDYGDTSFPPSDSEIFKDAKPNLRFISNDTSSTDKLESESSTTGYAPKWTSKPRKKQPPEPIYKPQSIKKGKVSERILGDNSIHEQQQANAILIAATSTPKRHHRTAEKRHEENYIKYWYDKKKAKQLYISESEKLERNKAEEFPYLTITEEYISRLKRAKPDFDEAGMRENIVKAMKRYNARVEIINGY
jgi:hypothetical protein